MRQIAKPAAPALPRDAQALTEWLQAQTEALLPELTQISDAMYARPELGMEEHFACGLHTELLEKHGFTVTRHYCGMPTAYYAEYDSGKPGLTVGFLAEYDALPGIGHGCGHNVLGMASAGAGILLSRMIREVGGKVIVYGTPAEETEGAKVAMAREGAFDGLSFAMMAHPAAGWVRSGRSLALQPLQFEFHGKTAHAASCPWEGINALDAALVTMTAINALREHMRPDARVHGIIAEGGQAANVVPDYCRMQYYVRSATKKYNAELTEKVKRCAEAGALATGCTLDITEFEPPYDDLVTNEALMDVFAQALSDICGADISAPDENMGSLDAGQVSHICPTIHPYYDIANGTPAVAHSRELAACTITPYAHKTTGDTAAAMALCAYRVMNDSALYGRIREEFDRIGG